NKLCANTENSKQEYIKKYREKYNQYIPPSWKSFEVLTFNTLFSVYKNLGDKDVQIAIAKHFGVHHEVLKSWIETVIYIRNICAHHSRLWNIELTIKPVWPKTPYRQWVSRWENLGQASNNKSLKIYAAICLVAYLLDSVNPYNKFMEKLKNLLDTYSEINIKLMGFPDDWTNEPLWKK
ncbi:Abi family protein, partial [uncultured Flavobacterium sp.]|uniref:Abi family protein n=1 Tax=uncultured Flavobacterium sp. TaxID=165435 RepID=UPI0025DB3807